MTGPFKMVNVLIKINNNTIGVMEGADAQIGRNGGVENVYGSETGQHAIGGKKGTFTATRWYMADSQSSVGLFYDLVNQKQPFNLSGEIAGLAGSTLTLSNCVAYNYKPKWGSANDIAAEEISGECTDWSATIP